MIVIVLGLLLLIYSNPSARDERLPLSENESVTLTDTSVEDEKVSLKELKISTEFTAKKITVPKSDVSELKGTLKKTSK